MFSHLIETLTLAFGGTLFEACRSNFAKLSPCLGSSIQFIPGFLNLTIFQGQRSSNCF